MTEPLRNALASALATVTRRTLFPGDKGYDAWLSRTTDTIIAALAQQGVTLTRAPERNSNPGTADVWYTPDCGHVHLSTDGTIYAVCPEGVTLTREPGRRPPYTTGTSETGIRPAAREPGLDVERLARAMDAADVDISGGDHEAEDHANHLAYAVDIAREYAALASEDRP